MTIELADKIANYTVGAMVAITVAIVIRHGFRMQRLSGRLEGYREAQEHMARALRDHPDLEGWQIFVLLTHFIITHETRKTKDRSDHHGRSSAPTPGVREEYERQEEPRAGNTVVARRPTLG